MMRVIIDCERMANESDDRWAEKKPRSEFHLPVSDRSHALLIVPYHSRCWMSVAD